MTTFVFREKGNMIQTHVGTADIVSLLSAAHSTYGWLGGLDGTRFLLSNWRGALSRRASELHLDTNLKLLPGTGHLLTARGPLSCEVDQPKDSFGGDIRTQLIGLTICALAHETDGHTAVSLFTRCMAPALFESQEVVEAIHSQLNDESHTRQILNEGALHGITALLTQATRDLNAPVGDRHWLRAKLFCEDISAAPPTEIDMVCGFLKWVLSEDHGAYATRSALVARVAYCLRSVGYMIGEIQSWHGVGERPESLGVKSVILVLGGFSKTDPLMFDPGELIQLSHTLHYRFETIGAMLLTSLESQSDLYPEECQFHFEEVYTIIQRTTEIHYRGVSGDVPVRMEYVSKPPNPDPMSMRFAAIFFPLSAGTLAPYYIAIANQETLDQIREHTNDIAGYDRVPEAVCHHRVITACIVLSLVGQIAGESFINSQHATQMSLSTSIWLDCMCNVLDQGLGSGFDYATAVHLLATIHCAHNPELIHQRARTTIAWRSGIYSIIPVLLSELETEPSVESIHLKCVDFYWANVTVRRNGSITSGTTAALRGYTDVEDILEDSVSTVQAMTGPWKGKAHQAPPDVRLYLSIERPSHYNSPDLSLAGRVNGSLIGTTGIFGVFQGLLRSTDERQSCSGHEASRDVINVKASKWAENRFVKPVGIGGDTPTYVSVQGDRAWALFLVGQSKNLGGRLAMRCPSCTLERMPNWGVVIGYC